MLNFVKCKENESQYDDYDLSIQHIVDAKYVKPILEEDLNNPYIAALPYPRSDDNILLAYNKVLLHYHFDDVKEMSKLEKLLQIGTLRNIRFPLPFHKDLEYNFYNALLTSYRARQTKQITNAKSGNYIANNEVQTSSKILVGQSSDATNAGFSLIGYSGCGKSSSISILTSHYPQVIIHTDEDGSYHPQITYLVVNCVANSNFSALYQGIGDSIDKALDNTIAVYSREIEKANSLGKKAEIVRTLIEKFAIGMIIFDEIQLIDFEHTKENSFDSLLSLANRTKVAIAVIGTEDARDKMFHELRTARRIGIMINGNQYCDSKEFFAYLVNNLFSYQWFDTFIKPTEELINALYDVTKGIVDQLIGVYSCMNYEYINNTTKPEINAEYVYYITKKYYPGIIPVLEHMDFVDNDKQYAKIKEKAELQVNSLIDKIKQETEMKSIIENKNTNTITISLKNVAANINSIYDEYTDSQIETAFNKVVSKKGNENKTEKEITRLTIEQLQKAPKRTTKKNKIDKPDISQMKDFLGIKGDE